MIGYSHTTGVTDTSCTTEQTTDVPAVRKQIEAAAGGGCHILHADAVVGSADIKLDVDAVLSGYVGIGYKDKRFVRFAWGEGAVRVCVRASVRAASGALIALTPKQIRRRRRRTACLYPSPSIS